MGDIAIGLHGAFTRRQAMARFGAYRVRRAQESGDWQAPWSGVLVDATRAADPLTLASAAVQLGGPEVLLARETAAHMHGCTAVPLTPIHLMAPYGHWLRTRPGLDVHNGPLPDEDRDVVQGIPVLRLERALTDVLCTSRPADALAVLDEALAMIDPAQREEYRSTIGRRLAQRHDPRGTKRGARLLGLATGRAASPAESWLLWRIVDSGFPVPEVNWSLLGIDGCKVYRLDLAWPELRIVLEHDGHAAHADRTAEDDARAEDIRRRGWIVVRARADDLREPGRVLAELDAAFRLRGVDMSRRTAGALRGRRHREPGDVGYRRAG